MSAINPAFMSLTEVASAIAGKKFSSREVTQACIERIARLQPRINAFVAVEPEAAFMAAGTADAMLAQGKNYGPLHGVPLAHKDMFYEAGKISTCGSAIRRDWVASTTSTALQRLKSAGMVRLGTLQMSEFAYGPTGHNAHFGAVRNPWNTQHITGGSSSGSGSAVAARLTFAALGSDTGGSIRLPAHFCGVTGLKTTVGLISRAGAMPLSQSLDTIGPLARTAEDCALLTGLMAGGDPADPTTRTVPVPAYLAATRGTMAGITIGVPATFYVEDLDADVGRVLENTIATLRGEGARIVRVVLPDQSELAAACQIVLAAEAAAYHKQWMIERPQDYSPQVLLRLQAALAIPALTYLEALRWRGQALSEHLAAIAGIDALLVPASPIPALTIISSDVGNGPGVEALLQNVGRFTRPINYLGLPALSIPSGFSRTGLPIGLQLVGRPFDEETILRIGAAFQRATDFHTRQPELA